MNLNGINQIQPKIVKKAKESTKDAEISAPQSEQEAKKPSDSGCLKSYFLGGASFQGKSKSADEDFSECINNVANSSGSDLSSKLQEYNKYLRGDERAISSVLSQVAKNKDCGISDAMFYANYNSKDTNQMLTDYCVNILDNISSVAAGDLGKESNLINDVNSSIPFDIGIFHRDVYLEKINEVCDDKLSDNVKAKIDKLAEKLPSSFSSVKDIMSDYSGNRFKNNGNEKVANRLFENAKPAEEEPVEENKQVTTIKNVDFSKCKEDVVNLSGYDLKSKLQEYSKYLSGDERALATVLGEEAKKENCNISDAMFYANCDTDDTKSTLSSYTIRIMSDIREAAAEFFDNESNPVSDINFDFLLHNQSFSKHRYLNQIERFCGDKLSDEVKAKINNLAENLPSSFSSITRTIDDYSQCKFKSDGNEKISDMLFENAKSVKEIVVDVANSTKSVDFSKCEEDVVNLSGYGLKSKLQEYSEYLSGDERALAIVLGEEAKKENCNISDAMFYANCDTDDTKSTLRSYTIQIMSDIREAAAESFGDQPNLVSGINSNFIFSNRDFSKYSYLSQIERICGDKLSDDVKAKINKLAENLPSSFSSIIRTIDDYSQCKFNSDGNEKIAEMLFENAKHKENK